MRSTMFEKKNYAFLHKEVSPLVINASEAIGQKVENPSAHGKYLMVALCSVQAVQLRAARGCFLSGTW